MSQSSWNLQAQTRKGTLRPCYTGGKTSKKQHLSLDSVGFAGPGGLLLSLIPYLDSVLSTYCT